MHQRSDEPVELARSQISVSRDRLEATWRSELAEAANPLWRPRYPGTRHHLAFERFSRLYPQLCALPRHARRRLQRRLGMSLAGVALVLAMSALPLAMAATITVNTDVPDINADGKCSLIEAIINANDDVQTHVDCTAGSGADTIQLPASSVHTLTSPYAGSGNGLPVISSDMTLEGNGSTIRRDGSASDFRIVETAPDSHVAINNTTITGGRSGFIGTAIKERGSSLTLVHSVISGNSDPDGLGSAIDSDGESLSLDHCDVSNNIGGGIYGGRVDITINDSTISGNSNSGISGVYPYVTITDSVVSDNSSDGNVFFNAGVYVIDGFVRFDRSTVSGNQNGGIRANETDVRIENSTVSGNRSTENGGGIWAVNYASLRLSDSTVTGNSTEGDGGGVFDDGYGTVVSRSVISGNTANGEGDEIFNESEYSYLDNYNLLGHSGVDSAGAFAGTFPPSPGTTDIVATIDGTNPTALTDVLDTTLKDNGGDTRTHALVAGSPAIDSAGPDCPPPDTDQRGVKRPQGTACDIGAYEFSGGPPPVSGECEVRTGYDNGGCRGTFKAFSLDDLKAYADSNFGIDGRSDFKHLAIKANLGGSGVTLEVESPCRITVADGVGLTGEFVSLDGRKGIKADRNLTLDAGTGQACVLSERGKALIGARLDVQSSGLTVEAKRDVEIGSRASIHVDGPVTVRSRRKHAEIGSNADVSAESLTLEAYREALVEPETQIRVSRDLTVSSTGNKADSRAVLRPQSIVQVGGDFHLLGGNQAKILEQATVQVGENLEMNARKLKKCTVAPDAVISYGTKSGNCAPALP